MHLPCSIRDYTDFYSSYNHAYNVGCLIRGTLPLPKCTSLPFSKQNNNPIVKALPTQSKTTGNTCQWAITAVPAPSSYLAKM